MKVKFPQHTEPPSSAVDVYSRYSEMYSVIEQHIRRPDVDTIEALASCNGMLMRVINDSVYVAVRAEQRVSELERRVETLEEELRGLARQVTSDRYAGCD